MDWSALTPLIAGAAPTIGGLLGGLIPFPGGAILGQVAGKVLAEALGVPPTPEAVKNAIETGDQVVVQAKLSEAEVRMRTEVEKLRIELEQFKAQTEDTQDARGTTVKLAEAGSKIAWGGSVVSVLIVIGYFVITWVFLSALMSMKDNDIPSNAMILMSVLFGGLGTAFGQVTSFWLGSSVGSKEKTDVIKEIISVRPNLALPKPARK